ncbi:Neuroendocrine convertase 1 [Nymphon striatum]|nr:Neuroendocrine convertase 1 [Nymphon striatum]
MLLANLRIVLLLLYVIDVEGVWIHKPGNLFIIKENGHKYTLAWLVTLNKHIKDEKTYKTSHREIVKTSRLSVYNTLRNDAEKSLSNHKDVVSFRIEVFRKRSKRLLEFKDPNFKEQWYLKKKYMNVSNVWENGLTGKGVTVCVIDDGIEWKNTDLVNSYNPKASYDVISNDNDPTPDYNN